MKRKMDQKPAFSESLNAFQKGRFTVRRRGCRQLLQPGAWCDIGIVLYRL
jgi:hypothetical protein